MLLVSIRRIVLGARGFPQAVTLTNVVLIKIRYISSSDQLCRILTLTGHYLGEFAVRHDGQPLPG
jgi:hypothetical protein